VEIHDDHFPPDAKDADWLRAVGDRGWIVLTKDDRIRYHKHEHEALITAGVRAFLLTSGNLTGDEMAALFVKFLPKMQRMAVGAPGAFIAKVTRTRVDKIPAPRRRRRP
jgi:hypothetical protein